MKHTLEELEEKALAIIYEYAEQTPERKVDEEDEHWMLRLQSKLSEMIDYEHNSHKRNVIFEVIDHISKLMEGKSS